MQYTNYLIIDDEQDARSILKEHISACAPNLKLCAEADSLESGKEAILKHQPDIVFLDVRMPGGTGFELLEQLDTINFLLIFTTAYDEYAIKAFRFSALDYLLKPIDPDLITQVIDKALKALGNDERQKRIEHFLNHIDGGDISPNRIVLPSSGSFRVVEVANITHCIADANYTMIYFKDKSHFLVSKPIKSFEELLNEYNFFRAHQSYLINLNHLSAYNKTLNEIELKNGVKLNLARSKKKAFLSLFESLVLRT